jgi:acetyl-CoA synthetase
MNERLEPYHFYQTEWESYEALQDAFEFEVPDSFDMATYTCDRWATDGNREALFVESERNGEAVYSFSQLEQLSNELADYLSANGIGKGDRIGVNLPTRAETLLVHLAAWKLGAVSVPLSTLFGPDALGYRLQDCAASFCAIDAENAETLRSVRDDVDSLELVLDVGEDAMGAGAVKFDDALSEGSPDFDPVAVTAEDDAMIIYTSGTRGNPKGVLHAHRFLLGNLPGYLMGVCNMEIQPGDVTWHVAE